MERSVIQMQSLGEIVPAQRRDVSLVANIKILYSQGSLCLFHGDDAAMTSQHVQWK